MSEIADLMAALDAVTASLRDCHGILADCLAEVDPERFPALVARIDAVLLACDEAGACPTPHLLRRPRS